MSSRPQMTLLIRTKAWIARADTTGTGDPKVRFWHQPPRGRDEAIALTLAEAGPPARRVWVLDSELWMGQVEMPAGAVAGLSSAQLNEAAAFEAEVASEIPPALAVTAVRRFRVPESEDQFVAVQSPRAQVKELAQQLRAAGARLAGLGHPAGLPVAHALGDEQPSPETRDADWRRVEFWQGETVLVEQRSGQLLVTPVGVPPTANWRPLLQRHLAASSHVVATIEQTLVEPGVKVREGAHWRDSLASQGSARWLNIGDQPLEDESVIAVDLTDESTAGQFVRGWSKVLAGADAGQSPLPMLAPPKAPASRWPQALAGVAAFVLVAALLVVQHSSGSEKVAALQREVDQVESDLASLVALKKKATDVSRAAREKADKVAELEAQLSKLRRGNVAAAPVDLRPALSAMMDALSVSASDETIVQSIDHGSPNHQVAGIAASPEAASRLAHALSTQLKGVWLVMPARIEPLTHGDLVYWQFQIELSAKPVAVGGQP